MLGRRKKKTQKLTLKIYVPLKAHFFAAVIFFFEIPMWLEFEGQ